MFAWFNYTPVYYVTFDTTEFDRIPQQIHREIYVKTTAYTVGDGHTPSTICADGKPPTIGTVAYNGVPLGTMVYIDNKEYTVRDRTLYDGVMDIYMDNIRECMEYGVQHRRVWIYD